jgi:tRNA pseudouridine55 synthase
VGGHVTALRRTRSGPFSLVEARPLDEVLAALADGAAALPLVQPAGALRHLEQRVVPDQVAADVRMGRRIVLEVGEGQTGKKTPDRRVCLVDGRGKLVAVAQPRPDGTAELLRVFRS